MELFLVRATTRGILVFTIFDTITLMQLHNTTRTAIRGRLRLSTRVLFQLLVRDQQLLLLVLKVACQCLDRTRHLEYLTMRVQRVSTQPKSA